MEAAANRGAKQPAGDAGYSDQGGRDPGHMSEYDEYDRGDRVDHGRHHVLERVDSLQIVFQEHGQDADEQDAHCGAEVTAVDGGERHADAYGPPAGGMVAVGGQRRGQAGLHDDDVILSVGGAAVNDPEDFQMQMVKRKPGQAKSWEPLADFAMVSRSTFAGFSK